MEGVALATKEVGSRQLSTSAVSNSLLVILFNNNIITIFLYSYINI